MTRFRDSASGSYLFSGGGISFPFLFPGFIFPPTPPPLGTPSVDCKDPVFSQEGKFILRPFPKYRL